jgi:uncharacterized protein DUF1207
MKHLAIALVVVVAIGSTGSAGLAAQTDAWLEGYAAAVLEREFRVTVPSLTVRHGVIQLNAADLNFVQRDRIVSALSAIPGVVRVDVIEAGAPPPPVAATPTGPPVVLSEWQTGLLPGGTLFKPLMADPRWPHFSAAYQRYIDDRQLKDVGAVSFGESFTLYRNKLGPLWWEVGVQAGVFSVFDLDAASGDLVNADYLVGIPLSARYEDWSAMLRLYHQSSHLGDEFLLRTNTQRVNLSYEAVDLRFSYEIGDVLRLYGGGGGLFDQDPSNIKTWSVQYGLELTSPWPARDAGWRPVAAADLQNHQENNWSLDASVRAGIQIDGLLLTRNLQILLEYFNGRSPNGQFYKDKIEYFGFGTHFHF